MEPGLMIVIGIGVIGIIAALLIFARNYIKAQPNAKAISDP